MTRRTFLLGFGIVPLGLWIDWRLHHRRKLLEWTSKPRVPRLKEKKMRSKGTSIGIALLTLAFSMCSPSQCKVIGEVRMGLGVAETVLSVAAPLIGIGPIFTAAASAANAAMAVAVSKCDSGNLDQATLNDAIAKAEAVIALYKQHQAEIPGAVAQAANAKGLGSRELMSTAEQAYAVQGHNAPPEAADFDPDKLLAKIQTLKNAKK